MTSWQPSLPGLTLGSSGTTPSELETAARATIQALDEGGLLEPRHALTVQLILGLSRSLGRDMAMGKITVAMSQATRQLLDAIATLPVPTGAPADDAWDALASALANADAEQK